MTISRARQIAIAFAVVVIAEVSAAIEPVHDGSTYDKAIVVTEQSISSASKQGTHISMRITRMPFWTAPSM
jgi:aspartate-semialdehyde dehydrogenase